MLNEEKNIQENTGDQPNAQEASQENPIAALGTASASEPGQAFGAHVESSPE